MTLVIVGVIAFWVVLTIAAALLEGLEHGGSMRDCFCVGALVTTGAMFTTLVILGIALVIAVGLSGL